MTRFFLALFAAFSLMAGTAAAQSEVDNSQQTPDMEINDEDVFKLGAAIQIKDMAAWVSTDAMLAELGEQLDQYPLQGWVTTPSQDGSQQIVSFIGHDGSENRIYYQVEVYGRSITDRKIFPKDAGLALSEDQARRWAARQSAAELEFMTCSSRYNTVVLTYEDVAIPALKDRIFVYFFAVSTDANIVPMGGHHRFTFDAETGDLLDKFQFTKSCLNLNKTEVPGGATAVGLTVSHITSDMPQEHHVFLSLSHQIPIYVLIPSTGQVWKVDPGNYDASASIGNE